jgi:hypothetical protein
MMLHNQDEIAEFDQQLGEILRGLDGLTNEKMTIAVRSLLANLFFHDFAEWSQKNGRWVIPDFTLEAFDGDDEPKVRSVASACITILKTDGRAGASALMKAGREYLQSHGVDTTNVIVSINEIAAIIGILPRNIPTSIKREFGTPVSVGKRGQPATWNRESVLPVVVRRWPDKPWSDL